LSTWVTEKESACSTNKNYLVTKATVLLFEGNVDEAFALIEDLYAKYPNDSVLKKIRESWGVD
tara:strand:- start:64 stop:252 length:189 start_codon:yes stop_codon:yes gene_type:complete